MRQKSLVFFALVLAAAGCSKLENSADNIPSGMREFIEVSVPEAQTKVEIADEVAGKLKLVWSAGDRIAVLDGQKKSVYELYDGAGSREARFRYVSGDANPAVIREVVYPAVAADGKVPAVQEYSDGTFDASACLMRYSNPSGNVTGPIQLSHQASYVCFRLTGNDRIDKVSFEVEGGETYTLNTSGVKLGSTPSSFYMVVPELRDSRVNVTFHAEKGTMTKMLAGKDFMAGRVHRYAGTAFKADRKIRLLSYNIGQCDKTTASGPQFIADIVKELHPAVAVMNEVKTSILGSGQEKKISEALGWTYFYRKASGLLGNMLTYDKAKYSEKNRFWLDLPNKVSEGKYNEDRVCLFVEFEDFVLLGAHLENDDFLIHGKMITDKVRELYSKIDKPVFLCGDMNTRPYSAEMRDFQTDWTLLSREDTATLYNPELLNSLICIDYIFAWKGGAACKVLESAVCGNVVCGDIRNASDHFPIWTDVVIGYSSLPLEESGLDGFDIVPDTWD